MWKRRKNLLYIGSVHGGELPEFFGLTGDYLGTDAIGMRASLPSFPVTSPTYGITIVNFINHYNPNYPSGSTVQSRLSSVTWPQYTLDSKKMLLFSDNATEEYMTIPDTYRADGIEATIEVQTALGF